VTNASSIQTVDRLVTILNCFTPEHPMWTLAELSAHLALPKTTLHRFIVSLEFHGILRRDPIDMKWRLGYRLFIWGNLAAESTDLQQISRPIMHELVDAAKETAILTVYHNQQVICIDKVETSHPVRLTLELGTQRFPHAGASSKVLMAYLPDNEIQAIITEKGLPKLCRNTITNPAELQIELAGIRARGYAASYEETDVGAWGVATPIRGRNAVVVAAIGVAGPDSRFTDELIPHYVTLCNQAANRISKLLSQGVEF